MQFFKIDAKPMFHSAIEIDRVMKFYEMLGSTESSTDARARHVSRTLT